MNSLRSKRPRSSSSTHGKEERGVRPLDEVFDRLPHSRFRSRFRLGERERTYLEARGLSTILAHALDFIERRLAPAFPDNDGKQTPMRGHPVFIAQHATATCCRSCLSKWHDIPPGRPLSEADTAHIVAAIERWLQAELARASDSPPAPRQRRLL